MVSLGIYVPRMAFDPEGQAGLSALALRSAIRGAGDLDSAGLAFAFERLGGTLTSSVTLDWLGLGTSVLSAISGRPQRCSIWRSIRRDTMPSRSSPSADCW